MSLTVNIRHLENGPVHLEGQLPLEDLDIDFHDEVIKLKEPLEYDVNVESMEGGLLVRGKLSLNLNCECVRCLKQFSHKLLLENWVGHIPLEGEESASVVNDLVDLTPLLREDILLEFPQHPLCDPGCGGLPGMSEGKTSNNSADQAELSSASAWAALNKLKL